MACGRTLFAWSASFRAFRFAASPTISIRSGMSCATLTALSPIDPVAPKTTTRFLFIPAKIRLSLPELVQPNDESQIEKQKRRREQNAVHEIERAADPGQPITGVFHPGASLDD